MGAAAGGPVFCEAERPGCACLSDEMGLPANAETEDWLSMVVTSAAVVDGERVDPWSTYKPGVESSTMVWNCIATEDTPSLGYLADSPEGHTIVLNPGGYAVLEECNATQAPGAAECRELRGARGQRYPVEEARDLGDGGSKDGLGVEHADGPVLKPAKVLQLAQYLGPAVEEGAAESTCMKPCVRAHSQAAPPRGREGAEARAVPLRPQVLRTRSGTLRQVDGLGPFLV
mmetsp:Transcript_51979/g.162948  ORF Transcript_51979/g.162948 Transcript_51979/m.162948 type:complete len:230 (+) Transcript_51979:2-691(+)